MAASDYVTPTSNLLPGTTARAEDVNEKFDAVDAGFDKLPRPRPDSRKGFFDPIALPSPTDPDHAATVQWVEEALEPIIQALAGLELGVSEQFVTDAIDALRTELTEAYTLAIQGEADARATAIAAIEQSISDLSAVVSGLGDTVSDHTTEIANLWDAIGAVDGSPYASVKIVAGTSYTIEDGDSRKYLLFTNSSPVTVTAPDNTGSPFVGNQQGYLVQLGSGEVTVVGDGATVLGLGGVVSTPGQFGIAQYLRVDESSWLISATPSPAAGGGVTPLAIKVVTDLYYTLQPGDENFVLWFDTDDYTQLNLPESAELPFVNAIRGTAIQAGQGVVSITSPVQVFSDGGRYETNGQYSQIDYIYQAADTWWISAPLPSPKYANLNFMGVFDGYVLSKSDMGGVIWLESVGDINVLFPGASAFPFDGNIQGVIIQAGPGVLTFGSDGESTVLASGGVLSTAKQYAPISYIRLDDNTWWIGGERA